MRQCDTERRERRRLPENSGAGGCGGTQADPDGYKFIYEKWLMEPDNRKGLENTVRYHAVCPGDMRIEIRVVENRERTDKVRGKLRRRYEDMLS